MWHSHLGKLDSKCRGHLVVHRKLSPPHGDKPESQGSSKPSDMPQVQVFPLTRHYNYLLTKFILFPYNMKYETRAPSMHWLWIIRDSEPSPPEMLKTLTILIPPPGISIMVTATPTYIHNIHHHNDIFNINNISSQCHYQHQYHLISMSFSTSTSSHVTSSSITTSFSYQYYHH